jgi:DNA-binding MarR family transcriptional regulator
VKTPLTDLAETIGRELVTLIRGAKDMHTALVDRDQPVLDPPAFALLSRIGDQGPLRLSTLAAVVFLDVSTISRQVQDLEQAGWVVRERDPQDRRASLLELTPAGRAVLDAGYEQRRRALTQLLAGWTQEEQAALAAQLARFNQAVSAFRASFQTTDDQQESA